MADDGVATGPESTVKEGIPKRVLNIIAMIRSRMRDYPELNRLISGVEHSDRDIAFAMMQVVEDWNTTPPLLDAVSVESFPSATLLIDGSIVKLLQSAAILQVRNRMVYQDGQIMVTSSDKGPQYMQWANLLEQQYEQKKQRLKMAANLSGALNGTGIPSEYSFVNGWFDNLDG